MSNLVNLEGVFDPTSSPLCLPPTSPTIQWADLASLKKQLLHSNGAMHHTGFLSFFGCATVAGSLLASQDHRDHAFAGQNHIFLWLKEQISFHIFPSLPISAALKPRQQFQCNFNNHFIQMAQMGHSKPGHEAHLQCPRTHERPFSKATVGSHHRFWVSLQKDPPVARRV